MELEAFSAAKDLVSLIALYECGGYYFDTTTSIVGSAGMATFAAKVPNYQAKENHSLDVKKDYRGPRFPWAAYAPVGDPNVELMIVSYLSRANRLGINSSKQPINFDGWDGPREMSKRGGQSIRNDIVGELIIGAVFDALLEAANGDGAGIGEFTWDAFVGWEKERFPPDGLVCVPELGIVKEYKNSWR